MLNYMRSEWYRITHSTAIYMFTIIMSGLTLVLNVLLYALDKSDVSFPYGTQSFSLSILASGMMTMFFAGLAVVSLLFSGDKKNGLMKNALAFGISREKMFLARCIICVVSSLCSLAVILAVYIGSAVLLLPIGVEPDAVGILLRGVGYTLPMAIAAEVLAVAFIDFMDKELIACLGWYIFIGMLPKCCALLGLKFPVWKRIAGWMPWNYLAEEVNVNMSGWSCMWETPEGAAKCLLAGGIGLILFLIMGLELCRKQEH
ncbi:MAG: hypothetical protein IJZ82_06325 [Lachnospiraceae bacterium]|nr:hypothetical protein [Lachnospiraceae bacterium]